MLKNTMTKRKEKEKQRVPTKRDFIKQKKEFETWKTGHLKVSSPKRTKKKIIKKNKESSCEFLFTIK